MNLNKVLCPCKKVTRIDILQAVADGAKNLKQIEKATGAMSKCGKCKSDVKKFLKQIEEM